MNGKLVKIKVIIGIILCFVQMVGINSIYAQENCGYIKGYNVEENVIIDAKEVEDFCEEFTNEYMEQYQIPGAAISIIQDGKVVFQKGYGYANLETKEPFTKPPPKTLLSSPIPVSILDSFFPTTSSTTCGVLFSFIALPVADDFVSTIFCSKKVFQLLQAGHFPSHFGDSYPHSLHTKTDFAFAIFPPLDH